MNAAFDHQVT